MCNNRHEEGQFFVFFLLFIIFYIIIIVVVELLLLLFFFVFAMTKIHSLQVELYTMIMVQQPINKSPPNNTNMKEEEKVKK